MKKVLLFLSCLFLSLTLASCNESKKHIVTYTDANGQEVEVEILQTEDEEEVKDILGYLSQKNQTANITGMEANLKAEAHAKGTKETEYLGAVGIPKMSFQAVSSALVNSLVTVGTVGLNSPTSEVYGSSSVTSTSGSGD